MNNLCSREQSSSLQRAFVKLETNSDKESSSSENQNVFDDALEAGDILDIQALPCEDPILDSQGVAVYGRPVDPIGNPRSASTAVNRIEFPDHTSTLRAARRTAAGWDIHREDGKNLPRK